MAVQEMTFGKGSAINAREFARDAGGHLALEADWFIEPSAGVNRPRTFVDCHSRGPRSSTASFRSCRANAGYILQTFAGWDSMTDEQLLGALRPANATVEATRGVLQTQVETLRKRGISWADIGVGLGISRQAVWERFS